MLLQTTEYRTDQIQFAFQTFLHRAADPTSLNYLLGLMSQGATIQSIDAIIAGSDEYYQVRGGGTDASFLSAIYQDFLNRPIDPAGQQLAQQLMAAGENRTQIVQGLFSTQEFRTDLIQWDYLTYLHRPADTTSLSAFLSYLQGGGDNNTVIASLIGSGEYMSNATA
jgi:hypothetical protein